MKFCPGYVGIVITEELANPYTHVRLPLSDECGFNIFAVRHCKGKYTSIEEKLYNL